ncbi:type II toxin-antitoxin system VapC family toxin [Acidipropionibacterium virtanenii]|uniref:Ribonuclease VapC n=1 Tax=Acidipropionibacterium virtanenii TaxID=2057246 RepID=A0A344UQC2_9ACTN|nr:PIN domain-containing protein [Acidipropionibacterium virtanenii]AXE37470.1 Ribonuclease VapC9 [Acidipropionibacterium virtanenii]
MIVVDGSAAALLFGDADRDSRVLSARRILREDLDWAVPEHWRIEVMSVVRGLSLAGTLSPERAARVVAWLGRVTVLTLPTVPALVRVCELRANLSAYDAAYVAVAESHGLTLVTADARISRSGAARCQIRVIS